MHHPFFRKVFAFALIFILAFNAIPVSQASAATAELFISEYGEGSGYNKYIEVYNGTGAAVDLSNYEVWRVSNGGTWPEATIALTGMLEGGQVLIVHNPGISSNPVNPTIAAAGDLQLSTGTLSHNGDDAIGLVKNGVLIDAVGEDGDDPGSGWDVAGVINATKDHVIVRKDTICDPNTDWDASRGTNTADSEWTVLANEDWSNIGVHTSACGSSSSSILLNEVVSNTPSTDWEFLEIQGTPGTDLSALTLIGVESDNGTSAGTVDVVISLAGQSIPASGLFVGMSPAGFAQYGVIGDMSIANNSFENSTATYFLVSDFSGAKYDDLDTDNDGVLDVLPWTDILDTLNLRDGGATDFDYGAPTVGPDGSFAPAGAYRCESDWMMYTYGSVDVDATPGAANDCAPPPPPSSCGLPFTPVYDIQGNSTASTLDGSLVEVEGIVTADYQDGKSGFTIQDATGDGDAATSDGIFVFASTPDVNVGDLVRVTGYVDEYYDLTEITGLSGLEVCSTGNSVTAAPLSLPISDFEPYEGMLVTFSDSLFISEYYNFGRYGEIVLSTERQFQPTATFEPGSVDTANLLASNLSLRIKLDDGNGSQNPDPAIHPDGNIFNMSNLFRGGDILNNMTGIVDYNFGEYKLQPVSAEHVEANPRTAQPDNVGGSLKVASFNVLNYFTTLGERGADTPEEFDRQHDKIVAALVAIDADVVGLIEIENNTDAIQNLVDGLNTTVGAGTYAYVDTGMIGTDAIKVAFIYNTATASLVGDYAVLDSSVDSRFIDTKNRPALAQTFMDNTTGGVFTVAVNHLKSKGSDCDDLGDPDLGDGAGNCNLTRTEAANALVDWLATDPTNSGDADFLIMGDLNAYGKEDPIDAIIAGGYSDLVYQYLGENAYSYVFDGQLGYLDHALANDDLAEELTGVTIWHINADEASLIDYDMTYKLDAQDLLYAPDAYRSSDHDPVVIGMDICDEIAPELEISLSVDSLWPANHKYVDVTATVLTTDNFDVAPAVELLSVTSSEADNGLGDGDTADDIVIVDDYTFQLRAERSGQNGEGRTYTITYQVTDACGNSTIDTAIVYVPFSQKKK